MTRGGSADASRTRGRGPERRRIALVAGAGLVPWVVVTTTAGASLVFSVGLVNPQPFAFVGVHRYALVETGSLPRFLLAWPTASLLYLLGLASLALAFFDREDRRVTTGLFALAGADVCYFAGVFSISRPDVLAVPVGVVLIWLVAWSSRPVAWRRSGERGRAGD